MLIPPAAAQPTATAGEYQVHPHYRTPRSLDAVLRKVRPGLDDFVAEKYHAQVAEVFDRWTTALLKSPTATTEIESTLAATLNATSPIPVDAQPIRASSFLSAVRNKFSPERQFDSAAWIRDWQSALKHFSALQTAEFQVTEIHLNNVSNNTNSTPSSLQTRIRFEFVGTGSGFHRENRVGNWDLIWSLAPNGQLKITRWLILDETRSQSLSPIFTDIAQQTLGRNSSFAAQFLPGIDYWRTVLDGASGIDIYGHNGVSFADIDGDGFDDLYICQPAGLPNRLFRNRGDGTFEDITESSGLGLLDNTSCALFADFSNSGRQDAIIVRTTGPLLFLNDGRGRFHLKPDAFHFANEPQGTFTGAAIADYDRDGWLDIYFCLYIYYQGTDQYRYPTPYYDANNGPPNFMFRNNRDGSFRDVTKESNLNRNNTRFSFCCGWGDSDGDGWPDLYVVNDFGRKNLYRNNGDGTFTDIAPEVGVEDVGAGMSVSWLDADNDGKQDLYVADMWTAAGVRISQQDAFKKDANPETRAFYRKHAMGNSFFHNRDGKRFEDVTAESGTAMGRWAWCSDSWDFDHDGYSDLYIANGMITGPAPARDDLNSFFWRQVIANSPSEPRSNYNYDQAWNAVNELIRADSTWSGFERNVFYANNGDGTFSDVSGAVDLDFIEDCRAFALADFDHDGRLEIVLKTRNNPQLRVLKNVVQDLSPAITFRLTGKKSNRDAIGARVVVDAGTTQITRTVQAGSGFLAQHSKELHFGLGQTKQIISATIHWPSGTTQTLRDLPVNHRVWIEEGEATPRLQPFKATGNPSAITSVSAAAFHTTPTSFGTWLLAPVEAPNFSAADQNAKIQNLAALQGPPVLLYFWASTSAAQTNLSELNSAYSKWQARGLRLLAINGDEPPPNQSAPTSLPQNHFSFPSIAYNADLIAIYNILYRSLYDRHRDLTLPTSFLLDEKGLIVKIYQGSVQPNDVLEDAHNIPKTDAARMEKGLPFPGIASTTDFTRNYLSYGSIFFERGYMTEAEHFLQLALRDDPDNSEALYGIGSIYLQQNKTTDARATFERVIKLPQRYPGTLPNARNNLGLLSAREGRTDEAIQDFQQALQIDPDHFIALENLGNAYRQAKRWDDAKSTLERVLQLQPDSAEANYAMGMVYAQTDDANRAYDYLQKALAQKPAYPEALNNLGVLYLRKNQPNDAEASFKEAIRVAPSFQQSYFNLARLYAIEGNNAAARQVLTDLLQQHPGDPQIERALSQLPQ
ncbi:MAG TPA: tetratricopeptide repeat protein [Candidatus Acidoferrum sp.]|nr:tetratricopeptide repeat protein [Candidatus Acidoferrum sp.]